MNYEHWNAVAAAFFGTLWWEAAAVGFFRWIQSMRSDGKPFSVNNTEQSRRYVRRDLMLGMWTLGLAEGAFEFNRVWYHIFQMTVWPYHTAFALTTICVMSVLFFIRTATRRPCGEYGWTVACILPTILALLVM